MAISDYITKDDYKYQIRTNRLDQILQEGEEDEEAILNAAEIDALALISFYLSNYYDMNAEFSKTGDARNTIVLRWAKVIVMYYIYERIPDEMVPERIIKDYDDAIAMLESINGGDKNVPGLTPKTVTDADGVQQLETRRRWGSRERRSNDGQSQFNLGKY